jgi:formylglycine-generating enzyme required for sulfatase activity
MKLVKGRDLRSVFQYIKNGDEGWTLTRALSIMLKMCEAVSFAHAKGVIHRDLKPGNIMVGRFGEVYVMDWGVARVLSKPDLHDRRIELTENREFSTILSARRDAREQDPESPLVTMDGSVVGTPAYMSPEQAMGLLDAVDRRSDIYSIGAILYHLLAGHMPYVPDGSRISQKTLLGLVVLGPPPPLARENPSAPAELVAICEKAMARAPGDRYKSVTEIAADIEAFLDRRPVEAAQPSWMRRCLLWTQRNRRVAIVACACAGVLLASWAAWTIQLQDEVGAKTLAIRETATWRDGLATDRLLRELEEQLLPLAPGGTRATELWLREAARLCALAPERRAELDAIAPGSTLYAESKHVVDALSNLDVHRARVERLHSLARTAKRRSIDDRRALWDRACSELAASMGRGAAIDPQEGLVPIRCDPESGLWEFLLLDSGDMPQIDPATQHYKIEESTGIVLVLLPGGTFTRGTPPGAPWRDVNEEPMDVTLAPFFLSKYETTQAQYMRYTEKNPSGKKPPSDRYGISYNFTHPVETVTWPDAQRFCAAFDCELPTESQWEYAARAGSTGKFPWGDADGDIRSFENVSDKSYGKLVHAESPDSTIPWDDGYPFHAPVGRFRPNRFGLHDMLGNVAEWVRDVYARNPRQPVRSDGLVENAAPDETSMVFRGGNFLLTPDYCYSAFRRFAPPQHCNYSLGFRIARAVTKRSP